MTGKKLILIMSCYCLFTNSISYQYAWLVSVPAGSNRFFLTLVVPVVAVFKIYKFSVLVPVAAVGTFLLTDAIIITQNWSVGVYIG